MVTAGPFNFHAAINHHHHFHHQNNLSALVFMDTAVAYTESIVFINPPQTDGLSPFIFLQPFITHGLYYLSALYVVLSCTILLSFHMCGIAYWSLYARKQKLSSVKPMAPTMPGVSIIKPLVFQDPNTRTNLESFFNLKYPKFQLLICIQNPNDSVKNLVTELVSTYKHKVDVEVFEVQNGKSVCVNPKINNISDAYKKVKYEFTMISDSRIYMTDEALLDIVDKMEDGIGIVHQLPFTADVQGFANAVEKICFGTQRARMYTFLNMLGAPCLTGVSFMFRKSVMDSCGGICAFGTYLAEDFFIGKAFTERKWKMRLSTYPAVQNPGNVTLNDWVKRMIRWCQLRVRLSPIAWFEPLQDCMFSAFLTAVALNYMHSINMVAVFVVYVSIWFVLDILLLTVIQKEKPLQFTIADLIFAWVFREISSVYIFTRAVTKSHIMWTSYRIEIGWSTKCKINALDGKYNITTSNTKQSENDSLSQTT